MSNQQIAVTVLVSLIIVGGLSGLIIWNETRPGSDYGIPILEVSNAYEYTLAEVATHNTASSCWAAVNGKVYDLTSWIGSHPGGQQAILSLCGHDASGPFNAQHGSKEEAQERLSTFEIGELKN